MDVVQQVASELRGLLPNVSVTGTVITATDGPRVLAVECRGADSFIVSYGVPPSRDGSGVQTQVTEPRPSAVNRAEMMVRTTAWGRQRIAS